MAKSNQRNRQITKEQKEHVLAKRPSTMPGGEKPAKQDAGKNSQPIQNGKKQNDVALPNPGKDWWQVNIIAIPVLIGIGTFVAGAFWSSQFILAIWITFATLSLTLFFAYYLLRHLVWREPQDRKQLRRVSLVAWVALLFLFGALQYRLPSDGLQCGSLTPEQQAHIVEILRRVEPKGPVVVDYQMNEVGAHLCAAELQTLLEKAGWQASGLSAVLPVPPVSGMSIWMRSEQTAPHARRLQLALNEAGFEVGVKLVEALVEGHAFLIVGSSKKP